MERSELLTRLGVMFAGFPNGRAIDPRLAAEIVRPLESLPDDALIEAIENFRNGLVEGMSLDFPPSIPHVAVEARRIMARQARLNELRHPALPSPERTISAAERARVGKKFNALVESMGAKLRTEQAARDRERRDRFVQRDDRYPHLRGHATAEELMARLDAKRAGA